MKAGSVLTVRITPRARNNEITEILDDGTIKIRLTAPPVEGKANESLIKFLAEVLIISATEIEIFGGRRRRDKLIAVEGLDAETAQQRIEAYLARK